MARFVVAKGGMLTDEAVYADQYRITESGALVFTNRKPSGPAPGQRTHDVLVHAFAPGRWVEVIHSELPQA